MVNHALVVPALKAQGWAKTRKKELPALLTQTPCRRVLVLHLGQIDIPRHPLGCVTAWSTSGDGVVVGGGGRPP
jgi:hypothetical protein